jgi:cytoskeletal protein CcmA (bactofilin family)
MRLRDRSKGKESTTAEDATPIPWGASETFIDRGCELVGELRFAEDVRIEGRIEGEIRAAKSVTVGEAGEIHANIEAETLEVFGVIEGDIHVARRTTLHKSARVVGEIHTSGIVVEEGAHFKGCIVIGADHAAPAPVQGLGGNGARAAADGSGASSAPAGEASPDA